MYRYHRRADTLPVCPKLHLIGCLHGLHEHSFNNILFLYFRNIGNGDTLQPDEYEHKQATRLNATHV